MIPSGHSTQPSSAFAADNSLKLRNHKRVAQSERLSAVKTRMFLNPHPGLTDMAPVKNNLKPGADLSRRNTTGRLHNSDPSPSGSTIRTFPELLIDL
jgi:hypothetical protein